MPFYEREDEILRLLAEREELSVEDLSKMLFVSQPTVRRDLEKLEARGKIVRIHGGASLKQEAADTQIPFLLRENEQNEKKIEIAELAAKYIKDGDTVMLDGSTSAYALVPHMAKYPSSIVITSGAMAALHLGKLGIKTISTGGMMVPKSYSYVGADAETTVSNYNADILFFSCRGLSEDGLLTDNSVEENNLRRVMLKHAKRKILLLDSSKIGVRCFSNLCSLRDIDEIITEQELSDEARSLLEKAQSVCNSL